MLYLHFYFLAFGSLSSTFQDSFARQLFSCCFGIHRCLKWPYRSRWKFAYYWRLHAYASEKIYACMLALCYDSLLFTICCVIFCSKKFNFFVLVYPSLNEKTTLQCMWTYHFQIHFAFVCIRYFPTNQNVEMSNIHRQDALCMV